MSVTSPFGMKIKVSGAILDQILAGRLEKSLHVLKNVSPPLTNSLVVKYTHNIGFEDTSELLQ